MSDLRSEIEQAVKTGQLLGSSAGNIRQILESSQDPVVSRSIEELVAAGAWAELNDRFYKTLAFGTGGLRGRTIGKVPLPSSGERPSRWIAPSIPAWAPTR